MAALAERLATSSEPAGAQARAETRPARGCILCAGPLKKRASDLFDTRFGLTGRYEARRCAQCSLEQIFPLPTPEQLKCIYESHYNFGGEKNTLYTRFRERFLFSFVNRFWAWIDGDISFQLRRGSGRLLDIGCNEGRNLRIYANNGFQAVGLELNENAAAEARKAGFAVHTCLLGDFQPEYLFHAAVLSNVLEHALEPQRMLADVKRILEPGGQVWISCPNNRSWLRAVFGKYWINWHAPFHISHFSEETLRRVLEDAGFTGVKVSQITPALWVAQSFIAWCFAKEGKKTRQLRNPFLITLLMLFARLLLCPLLWFGNRTKHGDCLLAVAAKP